MSRKRAASDDDEVSASQGNQSSPAARAKKTKVSPSNDSSGSAAAPKLTAEGDQYWELPAGNAKRRAVVSEFKNMPMVSVREYYDAGNGDMKPGKKGISLTLPQFAALVEALPAIEKSLQAKGHTVARPRYADALQDSVENTPKPEPPAEDGPGDGYDNISMREGSKASVQVKSEFSGRDRDRGGKMNFEETSDEDDAG